MTTVACVWVRGHVPFTSEYVTKLSAMVRRWMDRPYRFVCFTDRPEQLKGIETIRVEPPQGCFAWWTKLRCFDSSLGLAGRVLYLDLDTLIVSSLAPIIDYPAVFALVPHSGRFEGKNGLRVVKRFNSSVMVWNAAEQDHFWNMWRPDVAKQLWGDQDWIGWMAGPEAQTMPAEWYPRFSEVRVKGIRPEAKVILMKTPKNRTAARLYPWVRAAWA